MIDFNKKLHEIWAIRDISEIVAGKEWYRISELIRTKIVGERDYQSANAKKDILGKHIVEIFAQMDILSYLQTSLIIKKMYQEIMEEFTCYFDEAKNVRIAVDPISKNTKYFYTISNFSEETKEIAVDIHWLPSIKNNNPQLILRYDEYILLKKGGSSFILTENLISDSYTKNKFTFEDIVDKAHENKVSDIHITFSQEYYNVFFRVDGSLIKQSQYMMKQEDGFEFLIAVKIGATEYSKGEFSSDVHYKVQNARMEFPRVGMHGVDCRLAFLPDGKMNNMCMTVRLLERKTLDTPDFKKLGYDDVLIDRLNKVSARGKGLFLASGVTGSGKSTLIANMMAGIDGSRRGYTVEDPIEYTISNPNITQHQIYEPKKEENKAGYTEYTRGLKRSDPDVVSFGEMQDNPKLVKAVFEMADAGQFVYSTVHITNAFSVYSSLEYTFGVRLSISIQLILFSINQVLVKKLCEKCKIKDTDGEVINKIREMKEEFAYAYTVPLDNLLKDNADISGIYTKGKGCPNCRNSGYKERIPVYDYFYQNVNLVEWLLEQPDLPSRFAIERYVCTQKTGTNKLSTYINALLDGKVDACDDVLREIL